MINFIGLIIEQIGLILSAIKDYINALRATDRPFLKPFRDFFSMLFNSKNYIILMATFLIAIFIIIYYIIHVKNPYNVSKTKNAPMILLLSLVVLVFIFYFSAYRNIYQLGDMDKRFDDLNYTVDNTKFDISSKISENENENEKSNGNFSDRFLKPLLNLFKSIGTILAIIISLVLLISLFFLLYTKYEWLFTFTKYILGTLIISTIVAIIYYLVNIKDKENDKVKITENIDTIKAFLEGKDKTGEKPGFFEILYKIVKYFVLFIPCLLIIFANNLQHDIKVTPGTIYILFFLELLFICLVFLLPVIFTFFGSLNKHDLLGGKGAVYLDEYREIGNYQQFSREISKPMMMDLFTRDKDQKYNLQLGLNNKNPNKSPYSYSYSLTFYLYLNPHDTNTNMAYTKDAILFNYGYKPVIVYNGRKRKLSVKTKTLGNRGTDELKTVYATTDFKFQKWIYFVINYQNNTIDVFMDGKLVGSEKNVPPYFKDDKVTIGENGIQNSKRQKNGGIDGSIRDIYYFEKPKDPPNIELLYDLTKN